MLISLRSYSVDFIVCSFFFFLIFSLLRSSVKTGVYPGEFTFETSGNNSPSSSPSAVFFLFLRLTEILFFCCLSAASSSPLAPKAEPSITKVAVEIMLGYGRCVLGKEKEGSHFQSLCFALINTQVGKLTELITIPSGPLSTDQLVPCLAQK